MADFADKQYYKNADKGGVKNPENFADVLYEWSLTRSSSHLRTMLPEQQLARAGLRARPDHET